MAESQIDMHQLIKLVQENPVIWDTTIDSHKDKSILKQAWMSVCCGINEKFNLLREPEKQNFCKFVMKKWNYIKRMRMKGRKPAKNIGKFSRMRVRKYILHDKLKFLDKNVQNWKVLPKEAKSLVVGVNGSKRARRTVPPKRKPSNNPCVGRKKLQRYSKKERKNEKSQVHSIVCARALEDTGFEDRIISFCKGYIPSVKKFSEEQVLDFQMGVLRLIKDLNHGDLAEFRQLSYRPSSCSNMSKTDSHHDSSTSTHDLALIDSVVGIRDSTTNPRECFVKSAVHKATCTDANAETKILAEELL